MIIEKLDAIATRITALIEKSAVVSQLDALINGLQTYSSAPSEENLNAITTTLDNFQAAMTTDEWKYLPRTWLLYLDEIGFSQFVGENLIKKLRSLLNFSEMTSAQAKDQVTQIRNDLIKFNEAFAQITAASKTLRIEKDKLEPGQAELGVLLPKSLFNDELASFASRVTELDKLVRVFEELATGSRESPKIHQISSSDPTLFLWITPPAVLMLLKALNMLLSAYEKVLSIRKLRAEIASTLSPELTKMIEEEAQAKVAEAIREVVPVLIGEAKAVSEVRRNELTNELNIRLPQLVTWIDRGVRIEATIQPLPAKKKDEVESEEMVTLRDLSKQIAELSQQVRRYELVGEPILNLPSPDAAE